MIVDYIINKWKCRKEVNSLKANGFELHIPYSITNISNIDFTPPICRTRIMDGIKRGSSYRFWNYIWTTSESSYLKSLL